MVPPPPRGHRLLRAAPAVALALVLLGPPPASAGPTERLRDFFAAVNGVLGDPQTEDNPLERVSRVRRLVAEVSAVNEAAAVALGREWRARSPAEQEEFVALFAELLERAYVGRLAGRGHVSNGVRIVYLGEAVAGDEATVRTSLGAKNGGEARVEYRMVNRQGRWRVRDLVLDGISTVENYRAQFRRLLSKVSYQDLVGKVRAKLGEESTMFARVEGRSAAAPEPLSVGVLQIAPLEDAATDSDRQPPVVRAAAIARSIRSREVGWIVDAAEASEPSSASAAVTTTPAGRAETAPGVSAAPAVSYWVQVGAFETAAAAGRLVERLGGAIVVSSASGRFLLVRVGPFARHAQAVSRLRELEAIGYRPFIAEARE
ncbi:MAG: ABC transporter substrate-binding protein [Candidatus Rokubacteria bacterium]|nr:ABC transporter substrate-binding protein [Candidatus Rokubacteria bacterium]